MNRGVSFTVFAFICALPHTAIAQDGPFTEPPLVTPERIYCQDATMMMCGAQCVDLSSHPRHCGSCDNACSGSAVCENGTCVSDLWNIRRGFEIGLGIGGGAPIGDTTTALITSFNGNTSDPWAAIDPFGGGLRLKVEAGFRLSGFGIGFRFQHNTFSQSEAFSGSGLDVKFRSRLLQLYLRPRFARVAIGPLDGEIYADLGLGGERFNQYFGEDVALGSRGIGVSAALGFDVSIVHRLRAGIRIGINGNVALGGVSDLQMDPTLETAPMAMWEALVTTRYVLGWGQPEAGYREMPVTVAPSQRVPRQIIALVEATFQAQRGEEQAQVTPTERYITNRETYRRVAVAAPSDCANESVAQATGGVGSAGGVLRTECGVEMAELERALATKGYIVTSWRTMAASNTLPLAAARQFGADILFQVNSLERTVIQPPSAESLNRNYYRSNEQGQPLEPLPLLDADKYALIGQRGMTGLLEGGLFSADLQNSMRSFAVPSATLDVSAVDVGTGETIWLYRHSKNNPSEESYVYRRLARGVERVVRQQGERYLDWQPFVPQGQTQSQGPVEQFSSSDSAVNVSATQAADPFREVQFALLRQVVQDFVQRFQSGAQ